MLLLLGCGASTVATPTGELGTRQVPLPDGVNPPKAATFEFGRTLDVCGADGYPPAKVSFVWHMLPVGADRYVVDFTAALVQGSPNLEVRLSDRPPIAGSASLEPGAPWLGIAGVTVKCTRRVSGCRSVSQELTTPVQLRADGEAQ
ncbi:MAG: hypothetical protein R3F59_21745 [Myxococcota bacterium]